MKRLIYILLFVILVPLSAPAKTIYVSWDSGSDTTGDGSATNPFQTGDWASQTNLLVAGDTIAFAAGTYVEQIDGDAYNFHTSPLTFCAWTEGDRIAVVADTDYGMYFKQNNITVSSFFFQSQTRGIRVHGGDFVTLTDIHFRANDENAVVLYSTTNNVTLDNLDVDGSLSSPGSSFKGVVSGPMGYIDDFIMRNCNIYGPGTPSNRNLVYLLINSSTVENNTFSDWTGVSLNTGAMACYIAGESNVTIQKNLFDGHKGNALNCVRANADETYIVDSNIISNCSGGGIITEGGSVDTVVTYRNNTFVDISKYPCMGAYATGSGESVVRAYNNLIYNCHGVAWFFHTGTFYNNSEYNLQSEAYVPESGADWTVYTDDTLMSNPLVCSDATRIYNNSPLWTAGTDKVGTRAATDYLGGAWDDNPLAVGAYDAAGCFTPTASPTATPTPTPTPTPSVTPTPYPPQTPPPTPPPTATPPIVNTPTPTPYVPTPIPTPTPQEVTVVIGKNSAGCGYTGFTDARGSYSSWTDTSWYSFTNFPGDTIYYAALNSPCGAGGSGQQHIQFSYSPGTSYTARSGVSKTSWSDMTITHVWAAYPSPTPAPSPTPVDARLRNYTGDDWYAYLHSSEGDSWDVGLAPGPGYQYVLNASDISTPGGPYVWYTAQWTYDTRTVWSGWVKRSSTYRNLMTFEFPTPTPSPTPPTTPTPSITPTPSPSPTIANNRATGKKYW